MCDSSTNGSRFTEKEIGNLEFLKPSSGAYCYKTDDEGNTIQQSYIYSEYCKLIVFDKMNLQEYIIFDRDNPDLIKQVESRKAIAKFIDELTSYFIFQNGTKYEKRIAKTYWQVYNPQSKTPSELESRVKEIIDEKE